MPKKVYKVFLCDDHPILRQGLTLLFNQEEDLTICGESENPDTALDEIKKTKPDLFIVDISLKDRNGLEVVRAIKNSYPKLPVLVVSMHDETFYADRALKAGANGYVMKQENTETILKAVRQVLQGRVYLSTVMQNRVLETMAGNKEGESHFSLEKLTNRELEVLEFIGKGFTPQQIATKLNLSVKTIDSFKERLKKKLEIRHADQLRRYAIEWMQNKKP